ncbi:MAG TPA: HAMP domain-containing sensor histidine kinase, partial [Nitrososphaeraceae archaeon]|nr:HAMP domain-containing sensor histidine kinase [Nitrososphaeraceae archaeon]
MTINPLPPSKSPEKRSEILYGVENAVGRGVYFMSNVKKRMDIYFDHRAPSIVVEVPEYRNGYIDVRKRGGKIRAFTEITKENIKYCKELMKLVDELRHLNGVKGGLAVSETEYMATTVLEEAKPLTQVIYSSVEEVVQQGQYIFDTLWNTAIPAEQKIREIEEGLESIRTRILENEDQITEQIQDLNNRADHLSICSNLAGMEMSYKLFFDTYRNIVNKFRKEDEKDGEFNRLRWLTNVDKESMELVKLFLEAGFQIRHIRNMLPINFGVSDKEVAIRIEKSQGGKVNQSFLISNEPLYVSHFNSLFEEGWKNGIDASERIRDIEAGLDSANIEIIQNPKEAIKRAWSYVKTSRSNVSVVFPTANAFRRQKDMGLLQLLKEATEQRGVQIRILVPASEQTMSSINEAMNICPLVDFRIAEGNLRTQITLVLIDNEHCMIVELKDDTRDNSYTAAGLSTYSNSKSIILSYASIFEILWKQNELYEQLKIHDKMQREFIDVAAHELRTPIQPILGLTQVLQSAMKNDNNVSNVHYQELLDPIVRNAKRLKQLTEDILDVTKIESQSLQLQKELLNVNEVLLAVLADYGSSVKKISVNNTNVKITLNCKDDVFVMADRSRLYQVFANLLNNAIKFTDEGSITISVQKIRDVNEEAMVSVKDTGT